MVFREINIKKIPEYALLILAKQHLEYLAVFVGLYFDISMIDIMSIASKISFMRIPWDHMGW